MDDVVVVGAGPAGLMVAAELAAVGRTVTVLERHPGVSPLTRAFAVHARTLEALDSRGLADRLLETGTTVSQLRLFGSQGVDLASLPSRFPLLLVTPQSNVDRLLEKHALAVGVHIVRGVEVTALTRDSDGIRVTGRVAGREQSWEGRYAVGADGVHSVVRRLLGVDYPGRAVLRSIMLADVRMDRPPTDALTANARPGAFAFVAPFGDGWWRVLAWNHDHQVDDDAPVDLEEVRAVTRTALGDDFGMRDPRWLGRFHSDERQVADYRHGRVLLVGDAAHCHSPAGGQGMNTGIQDALNLGWKLAAVLAGAEDEVLDSYQRERHQVGRMVLRTSGAMVRLAMVQSWPGRLARSGLVPVALAVPALAHRLAASVSGVGIRYPAPVGASPEVGTRVPDLPLRGGGRLYDAMRAVGFVLVLGADDPEPVDVPHGVTVVRRIGPEVSVLVRPDGYCAWASPRDASDRDGWRAALATWVPGRALQTR